MLGARGIPTSICSCKREEFTGPADDVNAPQGTRSPLVAVAQAAIAHPAVHIEVPRCVQTRGVDLLVAIVQMFAPNTFTDGFRHLGRLDPERLGREPSQPVPAIPCASPPATSSPLCLHVGPAKWPHRLRQVASPWIPCARPGVAQKAGPDLTGKGVRVARGVSPIRSAISLVDRLEGDPNPEPGYPFRPPPPANTDSPSATHPSASHEAASVQETCCAPISASSSASS